jgi:hypothetical protein
VIPPPRRRASGSAVGITAGNPQGPRCLLNKPHGAGEEDPERRSHSPGGKVASSPNRRASVVTGTLVLPQAFLASPGIVPRRHREVSLRVGLPTTTTGPIRCADRCCLPTWASILLILRDGRAPGVGGGGARKGESVKQLRGRLDSPRSTREIGSRSRPQVMWTDGKTDLAELRRGAGQQRGLCRRDVARSSSRPNPGTPARCSSPTGPGGFRTSILRPPKCLRRSSWTVLRFLPVNSHYHYAPVAGSARMRPSST